MADMVMKYLEDEKRSGSDLRIFSKYSKMVLAVGKTQVDDLAKRFTDFSQLFPNLRMINREEIGKIEPRVVEGRDPGQEILALVTADGYTVDFKRLCHSFVDNARKENPGIDIILNTKLISIVKNHDKYVIRRTREKFTLQLLLLLQEDIVL